MLQNQLIQEFLKFCLKYLKDYKQVNFFEYPKLTLTVDKNKVQTLASFNPSTNEVICYTPKRLVADVFRSVAHELVHFAQNVKQELTPTSGDTGSPIENEANSLAGIILRDFGKKFPQIFVTSFDELVSQKCDTNISDKYETMLKRKYETDADINNAREQNEEYLKKLFPIVEEDKSTHSHKVFLGGTCADTTWRDEMIPKLKIEYFNPVVKDWTAECQEIEKVEKNDKCDIHFYLISKEMQGVFSIAEVVDSVHNKDKHTLLQIVPNGFDKFQLKSLKAVVDLINERGGKAFLDENLDKSVDIINNYSSKIIDETFLNNITKEETSHKHEYGCLMLDLKFKNWDKFVNSIPEDKLYNEEGDRTFGRELEPHCTVLYGFTKNTDVNKIKNSIKTLKSPIKLSLDKIDIFENEKYDVVKFNVISKDLHKLHKVFKQNFENEESYPNYQPHVTIAYVQKGFGEKFVKTLKQPIELESGIFTYSESNGSKHKIEIDNLEELLQVAEYFLSKNGDGTYENFDKVRKEYFLNEECECEDIEDDEINELLTHIKQQIISEALYQGHSVQLNKPMRGDVKKFKVYVKNKSGKIVKVNFGSKEYNIKKNNPDRKKSYCSRSKGIEGGGKDRTKANYWSRRMWNC